MQLKSNNKTSRLSLGTPLGVVLLILAFTGNILWAGEDDNETRPEAGFLDDEVLDELFEEEPPEVVGPIDPIQIQSDHILRAQLTTSLQDKNPTDRLGSTLQMNERGLIRVYLFTELEGLNNRRIYYDWYLEDERKARVTVRPDLDQMRASTSKFIDRHMTGSWRVLVRTSDDSILMSASFDVLPFNDD